MARAFPNIGSHGLEGNAAVGYVYVDPAAGTSMKITHTYTINERGLIASLFDLPHRLMGTITIRYGGGFSFLRLEVLSEQRRVELGLPAEPDWLLYYPMSRQIMGMRCLDQFRAKGFPHDVQVLLFAKEKSPEMVWARTRWYDERTGIFTCILLNEPNQDFKVHKNETVEVIKTEDIKVNKDGTMELVRGRNNPGICLICKTSLDRIRV